MFLHATQACKSSTAMTVIALQCVISQKEMPIVEKLN